MICSLIIIISSNNNSMYYSSFVFIISPFPIFSGRNCCFPSSPFCFIPHFVLLFVLSLSLSCSARPNAPSQLQSCGVVSGFFVFLPLTVKNNYNTLIILVVVLCMREISSFDIALGTSYHLLDHLCRS